MNSTITPREQVFISSILEHGYLPKNRGGGIGINGIMPMLFPQDNTLGYSDDQYRVFRMSINQLGDQETAPSTKRYVFVNRTDDARKDAMDALFNEAFKTNRDAIVAAAEASSGTQFYSSWKKAVVIDLPKMSGEFLSNPVVQIALAVATYFVALSTLYSLYAFSTVFLHSTVLPTLSFIATQLPPQALFVATYASGAFNFVKQNILTSIAVLWLVRSFTATIANAPDSPALVRRVAFVANQVSNFAVGVCWSIWNKSAHHAMIFGNAFLTARHSFSVIGSIGGSLKNHAEASEEQRLRICKEKAYAVWMSIVEKRPALALPEQQAV